MAGAIEALFIYDEHNRPILTHTYRSRPLTATHILPLYLAHPAPRPNLIYLPNTSPSTLVFSLSHSNLLFLLTSSAEIEPLLSLEFLHRVMDVFEEFLGAPLLAHKIETNYDVVAQLLNEMCDAGAISTTEPNALREAVEVEGWIGKLLGGISIPGKPGFTSTPSTSSMPGISSSGALSANTPALPWRRPNVRHTSNEIYVDIVETLSVTIAPSGKPLAAFANGTIACTSKISGVPDILLNLSTPSGRQNVNSVIDLPVFHPCVRLARWREKPGELSFVPPDGRFILAGYQVDLLPSQYGKTNPTSSADLRLPVNLSVQKGLGPTGSEFEIQLIIANVAGRGKPPVSGSSSRSASHAGGRGTPVFGSGPSTGSSAVVLDDVVVKVSLPQDVRNLSEIYASRGDTNYNRMEQVLEWHLRGKDCVPCSATLRCNALGPLSDDDDAEGNGFKLRSDWDYADDAYQSSPAKARKKAETTDGKEESKKMAQNLMPRSINVSFSCKGWLASGIKVESLVVDPRKSRGLGDGVKPYKGVKYLTLSQGGIDKRC